MIHACLSIWPWLWEMFLSNYYALVDHLKLVCAVLCLVPHLCPTLCDPMDLSPPGSSILGDSPGKNTGVDCHALLQRTFSTQGSNPSLPYRRWILDPLSCQGSPRILEWVAYPFSRGTSQPRNRTRFSCIAGGFFISWAIREALCITQWSIYDSNAKYTVPIKGISWFVQYPSSRITVKVAYSVNKHFLNT